MKHNSFAMLVSVSNGTADEVAFTENFVRIDFAAEFICVAAAMEFVASDTVAAEVVINLPDAVAVFVIVKFVLGFEEKVIDSTAGTG